MRLERALAQASIPDHKVFAVRKLDGLKYRKAPHGQAVPALEMRLARQFSDALSPVLAGAVHGATPASHSANAVYFNDITEARATFLAMMALGKPVTGWFWRSILGPQWLEPTPRAAAKTIFASISVPGQDAGLLAAAFTRAIVTAGLEPIARLVAENAAAPSPLAPQQHVVSLARQPERVAASTADIADPDHGPSAPIFGQVAKSPEIQALARKATISPEQSEPVLIAAIKLQVLKLRPDLLEYSQPAGPVVQVILKQVRDERRRNEEHVETRSGPRPRPPEGVASTKPSPIAEARELPVEEGVDQSEASNAHDTRQEFHTIQSHPETSQEQSSFDHLQTVTGAGLLLVIPSLVRLDFPAWLDRNEDLRLGDFARQFLVGLVARYQPDSVEALAAVFGSEFQLNTRPPTRPWHDAEAVWRKGLDRWLRHTALLRLHDLAHMPGELVLEDETWRCRFPLSAIQLGLRRHALDVDPGWTPWLGMSLRYDYRARADQQEHLA
ncbi:hypothetical protein [Parerythrobacter jejuensis]